MGRLEQAETVSGWGSQGPKLGVQADGGGKADAESRGTDPERLGGRGSQDWGSPPGSRSGSRLGIPRDGARALQRSHRWNRFLNRIDPPLLRGGRELRLVCTGGGARGPHGFEPLPRPPACQAGAEQLGRAGVGHAGGQHRTGARAGGWGREGGRLNGPGASRLPPPRLLRPRLPAPRPGARLRPRRLRPLRAPVAACASPRPVANQYPERRAAPLPFISPEARKVGRNLREEGRG